VKQCPVAGFFSVAILQADCVNNIGSMIYVLTYHVYHRVMGYLPFTMYCTQSALPYIKCEHSAWSLHL